MLFALLLHRELRLQGTHRSALRFNFLLEYGARALTLANLPRQALLGGHGQWRLAFTRGDGVIQFHALRPRLLLYLFPPRALAGEFITFMGPLLHRRMGCLSLSSTLIVRHGCLPCFFPQAVARNPLLGFLLLQLPALAAHVRPNGR